MGNGFSLLNAVAAVLMGAVVYICLALITAVKPHGDMGTLSCITAVAAVMSTRTHCVPAVRTNEIISSCHATI